MLKTQTINIVKSTALILEEHGETLTRHFYKRMFFIILKSPHYSIQQTKRRGFSKKQWQAQSVPMLQIQIIKKFLVALELVAQKHASLQIKPEHYPVVGKNLLASIREVLGEGATDEVLNAWGEAYGFLADILIGREKQIYHEHTVMPGGWEGFKSFRVIKKEI